MIPFISIQLLYLLLIFNGPDSFGFFKVSALKRNQISSKDYKFVKDFDRFLKDHTSNYRKRRYVPRNNMKSYLILAQSYYILEERNYDTDELLSTINIEKFGSKIYVQQQNNSIITENNFNDHDNNTTVNNKKILNINSKNKNSLTFYIKNLFLILLNLKKDITKFMRSIFLPIGFPKTVPKEYAKYQKWNLLQDFCSYLRGIMSTQAILQGMGVGRSDVTALQATIQWVMRDGSSLIGGLVFTSLSSYNFGQNVKTWRLFADMINNIGITLDMIAPLFGKHFIVIVCVASVCKALCGVAAGAAGVAISQHWGEKNGNIADVSAKNNAQHTIVSLIGLSVSVQFARFTNASPMRLWTTYIILTIIHIISNYKAMRLLALKSINLSRYNILLRRFLNSAPMQEFMNSYITNNFNDSLVDNNKNKELSYYLSNIKQLLYNRDYYSPSSIAKVEPILLLLYLNSFSYNENNNNNDYNNSNNRIDGINIWYPISKLRNIFSSFDIQNSLKVFNKLNYFIIKKNNIKNNDIYLCFNKNCTQEDQAKAIYELYVNKITSSILLSRIITNHTFPIFWNLLSLNEWNTELLQLKPKGATAYHPITS